MSYLVPATPYRSFGSLNNSNDIVDVDPSSAYQRVNLIRNKRGQIGILKRRGDLDPFAFTKTGDVVDSPPQVGYVHSIFQFINTHRQSFFYYAIDDKLYHYLHPTHTQIVDSDYTDPYTFINVNGLYFMYCNGRDPMRFSDGVEDEEVAGDFVPRPKYMLSFKDQVVCLNMEYEGEYLINEANVMRVSEPGDGMTYDATRFENFDTPLTGGVNHDNTLIVFEQNEMTLFTGTIFETWTRSSLGQQIGCESHRSISKTPYGTFWFGDQIYVMQNLGNPQPIDASIQGIMDMIHPSCKEYISSTYDPIYKRVIFAVNLMDGKSTNTVQEMNSLLVYNIGSNDWDVFHTRSFITDASEYRLENNQVIPIFGNYKGFTLHFSEGDTGSDFTDASTDNTFDFVYEAGIDDLNTPDTIKNFDGMELICLDTTLDEINVIISTDQVHNQTYAVKLSRDEDEFPKDKFLLTDTTDEDCFTIGTDELNKQVFARRYIPFDEVIGTWIRVVFATKDVNDLDMGLIKYKFYIKPNEVMGGTKGNY